MDGAGGFRRDVAGNAAGKRELLEQPLHPHFMLTDVGVDFAVRAFQVRIRHEAGTAVTGTGDVDRIQVILLNNAIEVDVDKVQTWRRSPVTEETGFDVLFLQRLFEERIVQQIDLAHRKVVGGSPVGVYGGEFRLPVSCLLPFRRLHYDHRSLLPSYRYTIYEPTLLPYYQDRTGRVVGYPIRDAAQQHGLEPAQPTPAKHDQIEALRRGDLNDLLGGMARLLSKRVPTIHLAQSHRRTLCDHAPYPLPIDFRIQILVRDAGISRVRLENVQGDKLGIVFACELRRHLRRFTRAVRSVGGEQNPAKTGLRVETG